MIYDDLNHTITFEDLDESKVGMHSVMLTLMDAKGEFNEYELEFQILNTFREIVLNEEFFITINETVEEAVVSTFVPIYEEEEIVSARVESMNNLGDLVVVFSSKMKTEYINIT